MRLELTVEGLTIDFVITLVTRNAKSKSLTWLLDATDVIFFIDEEAKRAQVSREAGILGQTSYQSSEHRVERVCSGPRWRGR